MVDIQSKEIIDKISDELKVQPALKIPRTLSENIQLVYDVNALKPITIVRADSRTSSGSTTMFTTPAAQDFFLTNASIFPIAGTSVGDLTITLTGVINGARQDILRMVKDLSQSSQQQQMSESYQTHPIQLDRGTTILLTTAGSASIQNTTAMIKGYVTDPQ